MGEYIKKRDVLKILMDIHDNPLVKDKITEAIDCISYLRPEPVTEVVYCKDCVKTERDGSGSIYCKPNDRWEMPENGYCYLGVKK